MSEKKPIVGQRVKCRGTRTVGTIESIVKGVPVVRFDDGTIGPCTAWEPAVRHPS